MAWQTDEQIAVCPLTELGFLRISTQSTFGLSVADARKALNTWKRTRKPAFIPCDVPALETDPPGAESKTTDFYLASLAQKHGARLATLDQDIKHRAAFVIPLT